MSRTAWSVLVVSSIVLVVLVGGLAWWVNYQTYQPCGLTDTIEQARALAEETGCDTEAPWP